VSTIEGKPVVVIRVQSGTEKPYFLKKKGLQPAGVFLRHGSASVPATQNEIIQMVRENGPEDYEEIRSVDQKLSFDIADSIFKKQGVRFDEEQKQSLGILRPDMTYSNLGLLLSDQCKHTIKLALFAGFDVERFVDRTEISGSLFQQFEEASAWIARYNRVQADFQGYKRIDTLDYPEEALREALLNSIIHRNYSYRDSILIKMYEDRIDFISIGGLAKGATRNSILKGVSALRNQKLAAIFYRLDYIEAFGTGIKKMMRAYDGFKVKPQIDIIENAFIVTLPNVKHKIGIEQSDTRHISPQEDISKLFIEQGVMGRQEIQDRLGFSKMHVTRLLKTMIDDNLIERVGSGPSSKYRIVAQ
jgi:ATP-dependent DNA helicase RecG